MSIKKVQIQTWLDVDDEVELTTIWKKVVPEISFLDDSIWPDKPVIRKLLSECSSPFVFLWPHSTEHISKLPTILMSDGRLQGPASGVVIQYLRSVANSGFVESGRFAIGYDSTDLVTHDFANAIFTSVKSYCQKVDNVNPSDRKVLKNQVRDMYVGKSMARRCFKEELILKYKSVEQYFLASAK